MALNIITMNNVVFFIFIMIFIVGCKAKDSENCHHTIMFLNKYEKAVYIHESAGFPDTNFYKTEFPSPIHNPQSYKIDAGKEGLTSVRNRDCKESYFTYSPGKAKLYVFVWDAEVLENNSWEFVVASNAYLRRYELTLDDLKTRNWKIIFPE